jgi:hypothetical protein
MDMRPWTKTEIERWAHGRLPHEREPVPAAGDRVLLREEHFGEPVPAVVTAVEDMSSPHNHWHRHGDLEAERGPGLPDPNVWHDHPARPPTGELRCVLCDEDPHLNGVLFNRDPWPWVRAAVIRTDEDGNELHGEDGELLTATPRWCREARVRGSAGWMREGSRAHTGRYETGR